MVKMKLFCAATITLLVIVLLGWGQSPPAGAEQVKKTESHFLVGSSDIVLPQDYFLLIRKGQEIGAIRFINIEHGATPGLGKSTYESYFQDDGSGSFRSLNVRKETGQINLKPLLGFHPLAFQIGNYKVRVGKWSFSSGDPSSLDLGPFWKKEMDYGYEFAPTSARTVDEIDASDKGLKWFRYDPNRSSLSLPVSELPK